MTILEMKKEIKILNGIAKSVCGCNGINFDDTFKTMCTYKNIDEYLAETLQMIVNQDDKNDFKEIIRKYNNLKTNKEEKYEYKL